MHEIKIWKMPLETASESGIWVNPPDSNSHLQAIGLCQRRNRAPDSRNWPPTNGLVHKEAESGRVYAAQASRGLTEAVFCVLGIRAQSEL